MNAIATEGLGKRYRARWALRDCAVDISAGSVVGLVGANGAGKSTLLHLIVGLLEPTEGSISVLGGRPGARSGQLGRVGFLAQDAPVYESFSVGDHLRLGERCNPTWDRDFAARRIAELGLAHGQRAGSLSGGQRSQLALTLAMAKRPDLLLLDEPVSSLDPLARREFLSDLMELVAEHGPTVVLSSHLLSDVERVCDHLIVLAAGSVRLEGAVDDLLATHRVLTGARLDSYSLPGTQTLVQETHTERQTTMLVRTAEPILDPRWLVTPIGLEDLVLAYMSTSATRPDVRRLQEVPS